MNDGRCFGSANGLRQMALGKWPAAYAVGRSESDKISEDTRASGGTLSGRTPTGREGSPLRAGQNLTRRRSHSFRCESSALFICPAPPRRATLPLAICRRPFAAAAARGRHFISLVDPAASGNARPAASCPLPPSLCQGVRSPLGTHRPRPFQPGVGIVDATFEAFRIEAQRIRNAQRHELAVHERVHAIEQIAGGDRNVARRGRACCADRPRCSSWTRR